LVLEPALPFLKRGRKRPPAPGGAPPSSIEIVAPDRYCTVLLLEYAAASFSAEIVSGPGWVVRLQPTRGEWALELLSLVERWLESARLPCANVLLGGRGYLICAPTDGGQISAATGSVRVLSARVLS
jgi:hypothetical protein